MITYKHFFASLVSGFVLVGLGFVLGTQLAMEQSPVVGQETVSDDSFAESVPQAELLLLTRNLAILEARLIRLEALGLDLVHRYNLDEAEFDFSKTPGMGGMLNLVAPDSRLDISETPGRLNRLEKRLESRELYLAVIKDILGDMNRKTTQLQPGWPAERGWISSYFGERSSPFFFRREFHAGVDIVATHGSDVRAFSDGIVSYAGRNGHYGNMVEIKHGDGFTTRYAHNSVNLVTEGDVVSKGDVIALLGNTGRSTGSHLHFEIRKRGHPINPLPYLTRARPPPFAK